jgi:hypothetical protein
MVAFVQGLQAGQRMAQGWVDTYERARDRREAEELKRSREEIMSAQPEDMGLRYTPEQGEQLRLAAESGQYDIGYDYDRGAYTVTPRTQTLPVTPGVDTGTTETMPVTPSTQRGEMVGLVAPSQRVSRFMGREVEGEMTPQRAAQLREQALVDTIADPMERQRAMQGLRQGRLTDMQIEEAERTAQLRQNTEQAQQMLAQRLAGGEILDVPSLYRIASETGADPQALVRSAGEFYDITEKQAKTVTNKLIRDIDAASRSPQQFNQLLRSFDPNPDDNIVPELRVGRDGSHQVFYGDQPMSPAFKTTAGVPAMTLLASHYRDQVKGDPFTTAVQLATLEAKKAQTAASRQGLTAGNLIQVEDAQGNLQLIDTTRLPRDANGQPIMPAGLRKTGTAKAAKDLTPQQDRAYKVLVTTDPYKDAVARGDRQRMRELLVANSIPPEAVLGAAALPPGQTAGTDGVWNPAAPTPARTTPATREPAAPTTTEPGLTKSQPQTREHLRLYNKAAAAGYTVVGTAGPNDLVVQSPTGQRILASRL